MMIEGRSTKKKKRLAAIALFYAILLTSLLALVIIKSLQLTGATDNYLLLGLNSILLGIAGAGSFLMVFHYGITEAAQMNLPDARHIQPVIFIALCLSYVSLHHNFMDIRIFFLTTLAFLSVSTWLAFRMALRDFQMSRSAESRITKLAAISMLGFGLVAWQLQNFWSLEQLVVANALFQSALVAVGVSVTALFFSLHPSLSFSTLGIIQNLKMRSVSETNTLSMIASIVIAGSCQFVVSLMMIYDVWPFASNIPDVAIATLQLCFIPAVLDAWQDITKFGVDRERFQELSRLTLHSARRLFIRHAQNRSEWSAVIGFKSATLRLEHDVDHSFATYVPNTLQKIRHEQVAHIIEQLIHTESIDIRTSQEKIDCIIDPETSLHPSLDALKVCATMYMDASSILEKRMLGLLSLIPIVNPDLSEIVSTEKVAAGLKKTRWFFYLDYQWIDQNLTTTTRLAKYAIQVDQIDPELRLYLLEKMRNLHAIGNFVWFSKGGQEKLMQEAPSLQNIITPHQIKLNGGREFLLFSIKFEELIPRLQRYHALDDFRKKIIDFEPNKAAQKLINIFLLQVNNARDPDELMRIVDIIASYRWQGFREKDMALRLLVLAHDMISKFLKSDSASPDDIKVVKNLLNQAISRIGYPSQLMNQAHLYKIEARRLKNLQSAALDASHPFHVESWATLASINYKKLGPEELHILRSIFIRVIKQQAVLKSSAIQARILESLVSFVKLQVQAGQTPDIRIALNLVNEIASLKDVTYASACVLLDNLSYIEKLIDGHLALSKIATDFFDSLEANQDTDDIHARQAFLNTWTEFKGRHALKSSSTSVAS